MRTRLALAALFALLGCTKAAPAVQTVAEIEPRIHALNGKTVSVGGYLGECAGFECRLFVDKAGWDKFVASANGTMEAIRRHNRGEKVDPSALLFTEPQHLGIGSGAGFDQKAAGLTQRYVVITGRITDECRGPNNEPGCIDRSTDLEPTDIREWTPAQGAPANT